MSIKLDSDSIRDDVNKRRESVESDYQRGFEESDNSISNDDFENLLNYYNSNDDGNNSESGGNGIFENGFDLSSSLDNPLGEAGTQSSMLNS